MLDTLSSLPKGSYRSDGYGGFRTFLGDYVMEDGTNAKLFIRKGSTPFLKIVTTDKSVVYLNYRESGKTVELYKALKTKLKTLRVQAKSFFRTPIMRYWQPLPVFLKIIGSHENSLTPIDNTNKSENIAFKTIFPLSNSPFSVYKSYFFFVFPLTIFFGKNKPNFRHFILIFIFNKTIG